MATVLSIKSDLNAVFGPPNFKQLDVEVWTVKICGYSSIICIAHDCQIMFSTEEDGFQCSDSEPDERGLQELEQMIITHATLESDLYWEAEEEAYHQFRQG